MHTRIAATSAAHPLGVDPHACLLEVLSGARAGRRVAVFCTDDSTLRYSWSDRPYANWSTPVVISSAIHADAGFSADLHSDGDLHVAYIAQSSLDVVHCRLPFVDGNWEVQSPVTVFSGDVNTAPSLAVVPDGTIWLGWVRLTAPPMRHVHVKCSTDRGVSWGSGSADPGDIIHSGGVHASLKLLAGLDRLHAVYYYSSDFLCHRWRPVLEGEWTDPITLASGADCSSRFDCVLRPDGNPSAAWAAESVFYREFDGSAWGSIVTINQSGAASVQLTINNGEPLISFIRADDIGHAQPCCVRRRNGAFGEPTVVDARMGEFDAVFCYHGATASCVDITTAARSKQAGDMVHPDSASMLSGPGDAVFFGASRPFRYIWLTLASPGAGGTVGFSYWDGVMWRGFTPIHGNSLLDSTEVNFLLWPDYASIPEDWQKRAVTGTSCFWIKAEVVSPFAGAPIGSRANMISGVESLRAGR